MATTYWRHNRDLLGSSLLKSEDEVLLKIGSDVFTRNDVATKLGHTHTGAIRKIHRLINDKRMGYGGRFKNAREATRSILFAEIAELDRVGDVTILAWMSLIEYCAADPIGWLEWDGKGTLHTLRWRIRREHDAPKRLKPTRTRKRR